MTIDWINFTPWQSLAGGLLIGIAASLLILADGRIAGISGIIAGILRAEKGETAWRVAFVAGLVVSPWLYSLFIPLPEFHFDSVSWALLGPAGLLVGFGSRLGSGCTSGHGVCGLSRLSKRSLVATILFIVSGAITVWIVRHCLGV